MIIKLLKVLSPWKWKVVFNNVYRFLKNVIKYHNFSFNANSKKFWDNQLSKYQDFWRNENYFHILDIFPRNKTFSLLDIGCAIGDGCELLKQKFPKAEINGADLSKVGIIKAKERYMDINYFVLDILKDRISKKYDYITIIQTLEHLITPF